MHVDTSLYKYIHVCASIQFRLHASNEFVLTLLTPFERPLPTCMDVHLGINMFVLVLKRTIWAYPSIRRAAT